MDLFGLNDRSKLYFVTGMSSMSAPMPTDCLARPQSLLRRWTFTLPQSNS